MGGLFMLLERNLTSSETSFRERIVEKSGLVATKTHTNHSAVDNDSS